jgi:hypothetical protein
MSASDEVGYKKPPRKYQFKKGISGNPNGRPKKRSSSFGDIVEKLSEEHVAYYEGGVRKLASRKELSLKALRKRASEGNLRAIEQIVEILLEGQAGKIGDLPAIIVSGGLPTLHSRNIARANIVCPSETDSAVSKMNRDGP